MSNFYDISTYITLVNLILLHRFSV